MDWKKKNIQKFQARNSNTVEALLATTLVSDQL